MSDWDGDKQRVFESGGQDELPIGAEQSQERVRWSVMLAVFLRLVALLWLIKGIGFWSLILGFGDLPLPEERRLRQALIVGFAILDCAAAVGVWLLTPWGKSLWLFLVALEIVLGSTAFVGLFGTTSALTGAMLLVIFAVLTFATRKRRR